MFERLTADARRTVALGGELAWDLKHDHLGTEHLLIALTETGPNIATEALAARGFEPARARRDLERILGPSTERELGETEAAALRAIGVDLDEVRRRTEAVFGPGALERRRHWYGRRRARVCGLSFAPKAKRALELALREAIRLGHRWIAPEHLLLGLLRLDGMSSRLLRAQDIDVAGLRDDVVRGLEELRERGA
jgi:ATP-dependent Clp protease ATP-binding subunit ClpA